MLKGRLIEESDRELLQKFINDDPIHSASGTTPDFFMENDCATIVYEDETGPIFFIKSTKALVIDIQFLEKASLRTAKALKEGYPMFKQCAKQSGYKWLIFDSIAPKLVSFCKKLFGATEFPDYRIKL